MDERMTYRQVRPGDVLNVVHQAVTVETVPDEWTPTGDLVCRTADGTRFYLNAHGDAAAPTEPGMLV